MGIYTKQGDFGETGLPGGGRISKSSPRTEAVGSLDELNATVGLLLVDFPRALQAQGDVLRQVQSDLYSAACHLAGTGTAVEHLPAVHPTRITCLENAIDTMTDTMPEICSFVLPSGCHTAALAHVTRTGCRRTERRLVSFMETLAEGSADEPLFVILRYINRLSDYLFTLARFANHSAGLSDTPWTASS